MDEYVEYLKNEVLPSLEESVKTISTAFQSESKAQSERFFYALIEAVHKQIPGKATLRGGCPRCHRVIYKDMKYCCDCGQALEVEKW